MAYLAIYRRFRPDTFEKMIGQEQVVKTLVNQIKSDRIGHAYLFCGARGTGKTSAAKIFARAINCLEPINGNPCGKCEACRKLADPQNLDILEIDAASNNKVDNVREIRDKIQYPPVAGKYKVYIIDEAHMLTSEAFNALLKTLEEPPKHAVIIMATTEPHKLPATILSRCMRFDFKLIPENVIADHIRAIYDELGKEYEEEAVKEIARAGEGSVRDALSVADTCISYTEGKLTYNDVVEVLGTADGEKIFMLVRAILSGDIGGTLYSVDQLVSAGKSVALLSRDLSVMMRNLLIVKTCDKSADLLSMPKEKFERLKVLADLCDEHRIFRAEEIFAGVENDLKYTTNSRVVFETAAVKATIPSSDYNIDALIARISKLEKALEDGAFKTLKVVEQVLPLTPVVVSTFPKATVEAKVEERPVIKPIEEKPVEVKPSEEKTVKKEEPFVEAVDKTAEAPAFDPSYSQYCDDYSDDDIPPEYNEPVEDQIGFDMDSVPSVKDDKKPVEYTALEVAVKNEEIEQKPAYKPVIEQNEAAEKPSSAPKFSDVRIWGIVLRKLRADRNIMLWIACQEQEAKSVDGYFTIFVDGDNEYRQISKPENVALIKGIISEMTPLDVKVVKKGEPVGDSFEQDVEKAKQVLGDIKIED